MSNPMLIADRDGNMLFALGIEQEKRPCPTPPRASCRPRGASLRPLERAQHCENKEPVARQSVTAVCRPVHAPIGYRRQMLNESFCQNQNLRILCGC